MPDLYSYPGFIGESSSTNQPDLERGIPESVTPTSSGSRFISLRGLLSLARPSLDSHRSDTTVIASTSSNIASPKRLEIWFPFNLFKKASPPPPVTGLGSGAVLTSEPFGDMPKAWETPGYRVDPGRMIPTLAHARFDSPPKAPLQPSPSVARARFDSPPNAPLQSNPVAARWGAKKEKIVRSNNKAFFPSPSKPRDISRALPLPGSPIPHRKGRIPYAQTQHVQDRSPEEGKNSMTAPRNPILASVTHDSGQGSGAARPESPEYRFTPPPFDDDLDVFVAETNTSAASSTLKPIQLSEASPSVLPNENTNPTSLGSRSSEDSNATPRPFDHLSSDASTPTLYQGEDFSYAGSQPGYYAPAQEPSILHQSSAVVLPSHNVFDYGLPSTATTSNQGSGLLKQTEYHLAHRGHRATPNIDRPNRGHKVEIETKEHSAHNSRRARPESGRLTSARSLPADSEDGFQPPDSSHGLESTPPIRDGLYLGGLLRNISPQSSSIRDLGSFRATSLFSEQIESPAQPRAEAEYLPSSLPPFQPVYGPSLSQGGNHGYSIGYTNVRPRVHDPLPDAVPMHSSDPDTLINATSPALNDATSTSTKKRWNNMPSIGRLRKKSESSRSSKPGASAGGNFILRKLSSISRQSPQTSSTNTSGNNSPGRELSWDNDLVNSNNSTDEFIPSSESKHYTDYDDCLESQPFTSQYKSSPWSAPQ